MHHKTVKFITQLLHSTQWRTQHSEVSKYQLISQIRQVSVAMLQQMFKVTSVRFHPAMQVCATDRQRRLSLSLKRVKASSAARQRALGAQCPSP